MDINERRTLLATEANPDVKLDYVVAIAGNIAAHSISESSTVNLRYIPDRTILVPAAFGQYLDALSAIQWQSLEETAAAILNDVNNELIARWVQVAISAPDNIHPGIDSHEVLLEDRQPNWDNAGLLSRLKRH